jgi:hypothetical protein
VDAFGINRHWLSRTSRIKFEHYDNRSFLIRLASIAMVFGGLVVTKELVD